MDLEFNKVKITTENAFTLNEFDRLWVVTRGSANIFCTQVNETGEYLSPLKFLYSVKEGELLFSLLSKDYKGNTRLIAFSNEASLLPIKKNELINIDHFFLKKMIDKWVQKTSQSVRIENIPRVYEVLNDCTVSNLKKGVFAFPSSGIRWGALSTGSIQAYGSTQLISADNKNTPHIAISKYLWVKTLSPASIDIINTRTLLKDEIDFMLALKSLEFHLMSKLSHNINENKVTANKLIKEKIRIEKEGLGQTLTKLSSIVSNKKLISKSANSNSSTSTLYNTCETIGQHSGIEFTPPKHFDSYLNSTSNQLYAIAQSSKVRVRKIILRGTWWKEENGHLLAFTKKEKTPVALIQKTPNSYVLVNLKNSTEKKITYKIAEDLEPIGYMFLPGFNGSINSITKIGSFAIKGLKKDSKFLILAALAGSLIGLLVPVLSGIMFDDVIPTADRSLLYQVFILMVVIAIISAGLQLIQGALQLRIETKSSVNLQAGVMDHLLRLPVNFYNKYSAGDLTNRALSINSIRQILSSTVMTAVLSGAFTFVNLILLFYYDSSLAWVGVGLALVAVLFMVTMGFLKLKFDRQISTYQGEIQGFLFEFLSGINKIRITGAEKRIFTLWADKFSNFRALGFKSGSYQNFVEVFNSSYPLLTNIFFFAFIYYTVLNSSVTSTLSVGVFMAFITAFNQFLRDCLKMSLALITSLNVITLYERVKPILEQETETEEQSVDPGELSGDIELNSINFRYDTEQPLVLTNVSLKIKQGEMVAFVGPSGSGKSTVMRLLLGFEIPESGSIYFDNDSFDSMNKELVRRQIGVVLQNGALMSGSIYKNIVGNSDLTLEDAWEAARMAGMEEDIKQMPMEMHTVISEGASTFSGGQKQRLMIARAIAHKPRLIFMDEATSALDNKTQNIVSESLDKLQATRIVIAHRLSTVKNADHIFVLDKGKIIESGTYNELMETKGLFSELAKRQIA